jgi:hypothetical protein
MAQMSGAGASSSIELDHRTAWSSASPDNINATKEITPSVRGVEDSGDSDGEVEVQDPEFRGTKSTAGDATDMRRMGKQQQLVRQFRQLSMTSFLALANPAWEIGLFVFSPALIDGGRPNLIWSLFCAYPAPFWSHEEVLTSW